MLPSVFIRSGLNEKIPIDRINKAAFSISPGAREKPVHLNGPSISVDIDGALRQIFMPSDRAKARNRRKANAWKSY
jgi:hypothetical protein